jgi:hypothetical protein
LDSPCGVGLSSDDLSTDSAFEFNASEEVIGIERAVDEKTPPMGEFPDEQARGVRTLRRLAGN